jgi:hypothetical protein
MTAATVAGVPEAAIPAYRAAAANGSGRVMVLLDVGAWLAAT